MFSLNAYELAKSCSLSFEISNQTQEGSSPNDVRTTEMKLKQN